MLQKRLTARLLGFITETSLRGAKMFLQPKRSKTKYRKTNNQMNIHHFPLLQQSKDNKQKGRNCNMNRNANLGDPL